MENKNNDKKVINCKFSQIFLEFVALLLVWNDSNSVFLRQLKRNNLKQIRNMKKICVRLKKDASARHADDIQEHTSVIC